MLLQSNVGVSASLSCMRVDFCDGYSGCRADVADWLRGVISYYQTLAVPPASTTSLPTSAVKRE
jgi:hypothetical protein